jgi:uncharacterized membrane protein
MINLLYITIAILIVSWAVVFFVFNAGPLIHLLLAAVFLLVIIRVFFIHKINKHAPFKPMQICLKKEDK